MKSKVLIIYLGDCYFDARCINMSLSLIKNNHKVSIISTHKKNYDFECLQKITFLQVFLTQDGVLKYLQFYRKVNSILRDRLYDTIICGDLYSLAGAVKYKKTARIIYDSREIYSDLFAHKNKPWLKIFCSAYENYFLKYVNKVIVTADTDKKYLKNKYKHHHHLSWNIIYNYPKTFSLKIRSLSDNNKIIKIIYQGVIQKGRGIKKLINFINHESGFSAIIIGDGEKKKDYVNLVKQLNITNKIMFIEAVPYLKLHQYTIMGDCGWALIDNSNLSNRFALPNKIFEYALMGIPVVSSNIQNIKNIVETYDIGRVVYDEQYSNLRKNIVELIENKKKSEVYHKIIKTKFSWEIQHDKFIKIIDN